MCLGRFLPGQVLCLRLLQFSEQCRNKGCWHVRDSRAESRTARAAGGHTAGTELPVADLEALASRQRGRSSLWMRTYQRIISGS